MEEDKVRTTLGTISLSSSKLAILNSDGLQPKLASDLGQLRKSEDAQNVSVHLLTYACDWLEAFSNGFLEIKKSPISGFGAFAVRDLEPFTPILIERELFNANSFNLYQKLDALTEEQRKAYRTLHGHMRTPSEDIRAAIWRTNRYV